MQRLICLAILCAVSLPTLSPLAGQTPEINKRAMKLIRDRKAADGITKSRVLQVIANEPEPSLVCLAVGMLIKTKATTAEDCAEVLLAASQREDCFHQVATQFAVSKFAGATVQSLLKDDAKEYQMAAATLLAVRGQLALPKPGSGKSGNSGKKNGFNFAKHLNSLVQSKDRNVVELALVAAAASRANVDEALKKSKAKKTPNINAAELWYSAVRGKELDPKLIKDLDKARFKSDRRYQVVHSGLSTYNPATNPACYVAKAAAISKHPDLLPFVHKHLTNKDIRVQVDCAIAIVSYRNEESLSHLHDALPKSPWPTKIHICNALGAIANVSSVPVLLKQLEQETGRFRLDCTHALASIFGEDIAGDFQGWDNHWKSVQDNFKVNKTKTKKFRDQNRVTDVWTKGLGVFYSQSIYSDSLIFVVDTSQSMKGEKIADLEQNLSRTTATLKEPAKFNVVLFGGEISIGSDYMTPASAGTYIADQMKNFKLSYATRTSDAIQMGCMFDEADSIYYLSDGAPVWGAFGRWQEITPTYRYFNRYRPMAMFTVEFNAGQANANQMKKLSTQNYGTSGGVREAEK